MSNINMSTGSALEIINREFGIYTNGVKNLTLEIKESGEVCYSCDGYVLQYEDSDAEAIDESVDESLMVNIGFDTERLENLLAIDLYDHLANVKIPKNRFSLERLKEFVMKSALERLINGDFISVGIQGTFRKEDKRASDLAKLFSNWD